MSERERATRVSRPRGAGHGAPASDGREGVPGDEVPRTQTTVARFSRLERKEHLAVMVLFAVLALTGFPQKFYDHHWAQVLTGWLGGVDTARWFHRAAGITFGALLVAHVLRLVVSVVRQTTTLSMVPTRQDFRDAVQTIDYYLRRSASAPRFDHFDYRQKFEYWGMLLGSAVV